MAAAASIFSAAAQLSYDACVGYFNQHHNTLNTSWSMVSGFSHGWGHYTTSCYGNEGEQTTQEATDKAMARCTADYGANCHVFATSQGSPAWVDAIDHHNGRDPGVNVDTPSGNVATAAVQTETSSGSSDWDFSNVLRKTVGGVAMFAGTVSGDTNLQMQCLRVLIDGIFGKKRRNILPIIARRSVSEIIATAPARRRTDRTRRHPEFEL